MQGKLAGLKLEILKRAVVVKNQFSFLFGLNELLTWHLWRRAKWLLSFREKLQWLLNEFIIVGRSPFACFPRPDLRPKFFF